MTQPKSLVERLRAIRSAMCAEAASRIEELERERDHERASVKALRLSNDAAHAECLRLRILLENVKVCLRVDMDAPNRDAEHLRGVARAMLRELDDADADTRAETAESKASRLEEENGRLREALEIIETWKAFPATGKSWHDDPARPMSYGFCYGSNGERDFMRDVARSALRKETT